MTVGNNIREVRHFACLNQTDFGNLFGLSRGQIDSYERNVALPSISTINAICSHYNISFEVMNSKDLKMNPGLLYSKKSSPELQILKYEDIIKSKDELIKEQRDYIRFLQKQIEKMSEKK